MRADKKHKNTGKKIKIYILVNLDGIYIIKQQYFYTILEDLQTLEDITFSDTADLVLHLTLDVAGTNLDLTETPLTHMQRLPT